MKNIKFLSVVAAVCLMLFSGILFTACKDNSLTINFESNGGTVCSPIEYTQDSTLILPEPTREEYLFGGWYEDNGTWEQKFDQSNINSYIDNNSLTLYAKWLKKVNLVFVSDDNFDDIYLDSLDIVLPTPTRDGYTFDCWCVDIELTKPYTIETVVEADSYNEVYLYPRWETSKTIYYYSDIDAPFEKTSDVVEVSESIMLYQPIIKYYQFDGWFFDSELTEPVPNRISNDMLKNKDNVLYAKFTQKEIERVEVIGTIKTEYEYGESFDAGTARLLTNHKHAQYQAEVLDITHAMVQGFYPQDKGKRGYYLYDNELDNDEVYLGSVNFYIFDHRGTQIAKTAQGIDYIVKSDIETFTINKEIVFEFGEYVSLENKGIAVSWTDEQGQKIEFLNDEDLNYYTSDLSTNKIGTFKFSLRFHYRTIEFEYTVNDTNITWGYVDKGSYDDPILLNTRTSLLDQDIYVVNEDTNMHINYDGLTQTQIIKDIDTSTAGYNTAIINISGNEVEIEYYVVALKQIQELKVIRTYEQQDEVNFFEATITMEDGVTFRQSFDYYDDYCCIIENVDTTTSGTHYVKVYFYGEIFDVEYVVR